MVQSANRGLHYLFQMQNQPLPVIAEWAIEFAVIVAKWDRRARTRKALARLDRTRLADIDVTPQQADDEIAKRFWQE